MTILCVDDNVKFLSSMVERLQVEGFDVDGVSTCESAIAAFIAKPFGYDVVITDMAFPGGEDGEQLVAKLIELRESRGYEAAPEIICITGDERKIRSELVNALRERGCQYVLKGGDQYVVETQAAMMRLQKMRREGPTFLFVHQGSDRYEWDNKAIWSCTPGEVIKEVRLLHSGGRELVDMAPAPRRLFDFLARHTSRRAFSVEEVANSISLDEFYNFWQRHENTDTRDSVKNNVHRIRVALDRVFRKMGSPFESDKVLSTQTYEDTSEPSFRIESQINSSGRIQVAAIDSLLPYSEKDEWYRVNARVYVEHIPRSQHLPL